MASKFRIKPVPNAAADVPPQGLPDILAMPTPEQANEAAQVGLTKDGFSPSTIHNVMRPAPSALSFSHGAVEAGRLDTVARQEEVLKIGMQEAAEDITLAPAEMDALAAYAEKTMDQHSKGLAEARSWWQRLKRGVGDRVGRVVGENVMEFSAGLALLDFGSYLNKKARLQFVPQEKRAEIEARVLPKVVLQGQSYGSPTSAMLHQFGQTLWAPVKETAGVIQSTLARTPEQLLAGQQKIQEASEIRARTTSNVPAIGASIGPRLSWQEVIESHADENAIDEFYARLDQAPPGYREGAFAAIALGDALAEMAGDVMLVAGQAAAKIPSLGRAVLAKTVPGKVAQIRADVARKTFRFEDAVAAEAAAKANVQVVEKAVATQARSTGGQISMENAKKLILARQQWANEKIALERFSDAGPNESILRRSAKRSPIFEPELKTTEPYTQYVVNKTGQPGPPIFARESTREVPRSVDDLAVELHEFRKAELVRDADQPIAWDRVDDLPLFQQRQLLGPDDAEQAGDALNHMVRTGGIGFDDVAMTPQAPELKLVPDSQISLIDWNRIDVANARTKAEAQFLGTSGARQYDLGLSAGRSLARQMDIVRRNLGLARQQKNAPAIKLYAKELGQLKRYLKKNPIEDVKATKYEDSWLPKAQPGIMQDANRYNSWLSAAGDRAMRSLYPGGLAVNSFWDTSTGQVMAPLREPQRFYETYDPDTWERVRGAYLRFQTQQRSWYESLTAGAEKAGVLQRRSKWNPAREFSEFDIVEGQNRLLFDMLDEPAGTPAHDALMASASPELRQFHDVIRRELNHAADLQGISNTNKYLTGYIRHVVTADMFAGGARPTEMLGLPAKAEVFASHLLRRTGKGGEYPRDAMLALDLYGRGMYRKITLEPMFEDVVASGARLATQHQNPAFKTYAHDLVARLKGRPTLAGKHLDDWVGGALNKDGKVRWQPQTIDRALTGLLGFGWAGSLPGNPRYPVMQMATGIATTQSRFGLFRTSRALFEMGTLEGQALNKQIGTYQQFLNIFESDFMRRLTTLITKRAYLPTPFGFVSTGQTEEMTRGITALAAVDMYMTSMGIASWGEARAAGMANRIAFEALRASEEVNHMYGILGRSPWVTERVGSTGVTSAATQFLSFIPKQTEELLAQFNRDPGNIARYLGFSGMVSRLAAEQLGVDLTDYVGFGYLPETPGDMSSPAFDAFIQNLDLLYAASTRDPDGAAQASTKLLDTLDNLVPMLVAFESAGKAAQSLRSGAQTTSLGDRQRPLALGQFGEEKTADAFVRSITPAGEDLPFTLGGREFEGLGGDIWPTVTGQQAIREKLFQRGKAAVQENERRFIYDMRSSIRQFIDAIESGNIPRAKELEELLTSKYGELLAGDTAIEKAVEARSLSWTLRTIERLPDDQLSQAVEIMRSYGLSLEP